MAVAVIDFLKMINITDNNGKPLVIADSAFKRLGKIFVQVPPVEHLGQGSVMESRAISLLRCLSEDSSRITRSAVVSRAMSSASSTGLVR